MTQHFGRQIKGIAFDLEGTLVDMERTRHTAHVVSAREIGVHLDLEDIDDIVARVPHFVGGPGTQRELYALGNGSMTFAQFKTLDEEILQKLWQPALEQLTPRPGSLEYIRQARQLGIPMIIGTATYPETAMELVNAAGLDHFFSPENIVTLDDIANAKPAPDVWYETSRRMGIAPEIQLIFEDSARGVTSAVASGGLVFGVPVYDSQGLRRALENAGAHAVYQDWHDVPLLPAINGERENDSRKELR